MLRPIFRLGNLRVFECDEVDAVPEVAARRDLVNSKTQFGDSE
jgi:hypothetical protein